MNGAQRRAYNSCPPAWLVLLYVSLQPILTVLSVYEGKTFHPHIVVALTLKKNFFLEFPC